MRNYTKIAATFILASSSHVTYADEISYFDTIGIIKAGNHLCGKSFSSTTIRTYIRQAAALEGVSFSEGSRRVDERARNVVKFNLFGDKEQLCKWMKEMGPYTKRKLDEELSRRSL